MGTNKKNAFSHLVHLCANLDCFDVCAIQRGAEEEELRNLANSPLADTIIAVPKEGVDPIVQLAKEDTMKTIANRIGENISGMDYQKLDNLFVLKHMNACKTNDREAIIAYEYLRKVNVGHDDVLRSCFTPMCASSVSFSSMKICL